jgi:Domain of unknown function (DUF4391)
MTQILLSVMAIPAACELNKPVFKKMFLEKGELDATDKKALSNDIERIRWLYTLKPSTMNIPKFEDEHVEYQEVAVLQIDLSSPTRIKRITSFINKAIPYPLFLIFSHNDTFAVSVANKRINQADKAKWVVEEPWLTDWICEAAPTDIQSKFIEDCSLKNLSSLNFYAFYQDIVSRVVALNAASRSGTYTMPTRDKTESRRVQLREIAELERQAAELRTSLNQETQFNRKLELNMAIKERVDKISKLEEVL